MGASLTFGKERLVFDGTEVAILAALHATLQARDPDVLLTTGGDSFLWPYLHASASPAGVAPATFSRSGPAARGRAAGRLRMAFTSAPAARTYSSRCNSRQPIRGRDSKPAQRSGITMPDTGHSPPGRRAGHHRRRPRRSGRGRDAGPDVAAPAVDRARPLGRRPRHCLNRHRPAGTPRARTRRALFLKHWIGASVPRAPLPLEGLSPHPSHAKPFTRSLHTIR
jgi:hypothetical protein